MPGETKIEWTRGDDGSPGKSWNPVTGCTKVSAGCEHCYAERFAERWRGVPGHPYEQGFDLRLWPDRLAAPLRWQRPRRIFVNSMADLWHAGVPGQFIVDVFATMALAIHHTFLVLTKRPQRMRKLLCDEDFADSVLRRHRRLATTRGVAPHESPFPDWPLPNVWLGVSVEDQGAAFRIKHLLHTPATVRFLSCEPLIGPLNLRNVLSGNGFQRVNPLTGTVSGFTGQGGGRLLPPVDWVIAGGESGPGFRPVDLDWVRDLRDQCIYAGVPFFFKQVGGLRAKAGGRELDGRTWDQFPKEQTA